MTTEAFGPFLAKRRKKKRLTSRQYRRKARGRILAAGAGLVLTVCLFLFPFYHAVPVWSPSCFTTGEITKLLSIGSREARDEASGGWRRLYCKERGITPNGNLSAVPQATFKSILNGESRNPGGGVLWGASLTPSQKFPCIPSVLLL